MAARRLYPLMRLPLNPMAMKFQTGQALNSPVSESAAFAYGTVFNRLPAGNMYMNVSHDGLCRNRFVTGYIAKWIQTTVPNPPMALCRRLFAADPLDRAIFGMLFRKKN